MLCLRCSRGFNSSSIPSVVSRTIQKSNVKVSSRRTFTSFTPLRPTVFPSSFRSSLYDPKPATASATIEIPLDLLPKISTHPALGATQVRCGPRNTFSPSHFVRKRRHGFLSRIRTRKGRNLLTRRKLKKRSTLSH